MLVSGSVNVHDVVKFFMPEKKNRTCIRYFLKIPLVRIQHCMICRLQRRILPTSTSNATSENKKSNPKSQSLKPWRNLQCLTLFGPFEDLFVKPRSCKIPPPPRPRAKTACRNFCSSKVFCASTASGTPGTKGGCFSKVVIWMY